MRYCTALLALALLVGSLRAQPQLRLEQTGLPPAVGSLLQVGDMVFQTTYRGLYAFENETRSWRFVGKASTSLIGSAWTVHPNGFVVIPSDVRTIEFDAKSESIIVHDGIRFDARLSDTLVARLDVDHLSPTAKRLRLAWLRWPSMDTARVDVQEIDAEQAYNFIIPCFDGSLIAVTSSGVCRFHYDRAPVVTPISGGINSDRHYVYSDVDRTHIALTGRNHLVYSADVFDNYVPFATLHSDSINQVRVSASPYTMFVAHGRTVERFDVLSGNRMILRQNLPSRFRNFAAQGDTVVIGIIDSVLLVSPEQTILVNEGLPIRPLARITSLSNGLVAAGAAEVLVKPSAGEWETIRFGSEESVFRNTPQHSSIIPMGGKSIDDFVVLAGDAVVHVNPRPLIEKIDYGYPGYIFRGVHTKAGLSYFTMLYAVDGLACGTNQVSWVSGNSPIRTILCKDDLRTFMVFNDSDYVALTREGIAWRTINGDLDNWTSITTPEIASVNIMRTSTKGNNGLASVYGFMMWTNDAGQTWSHEEGDVQYSAITTNGDVFTVRTSDNQDSALVIEVRANNLTTVMAVYSLDDLPGPTMELRDVAYDDTEQRLYITTNSWTASIPIVTSSVHTYNQQAMPSTLFPHGLYDVFGRYVAQDEQSIASAGLYFRVDSSGVTRLIIAR